MSEKERESFFRGAVSRAAGKRQIKPSNAFLDGELHHLTESFGDEEDDEDFTERDQSDASSLSSEEEEEDDELEDEDESSKTGYESGPESEKDEVDDESKDNKDIPSTSSAAQQKTTHPKQRINGIINIDDDDQMDTNLESQKICSICLDLNKHSDRLGELIQCDKCGIRVHESCYGIGGEEQTTSSEVAQSMSSSASTEPWFCEPCLLGNGIRPHCELCPSRFGAFKRTDIQGCWAHLICALFTPGITFTEPDHLSGINWDDIDRNFGRKPCAGCTDRLESRVGITVKCDAGLCKNYFHVTCAQRLGLLIENPSYHRSSLNHEAGYLYCKIHNHNEDLIHKQKSAYKKFIKQENERMVEFKRINMDDRQEEKWRRQLDERLKQIELATAATSSSTNDSSLQKKAKFLHTRAKYLNGFAEKAEELLGMSRKQFEDEFWNIPASQLTIGLPPTFSKAFVGYVEYRESTLFGEEEEKLKRNKQHRDELLENQKGIADGLKNVRMERDELAQKSENQNELYEKLKTAIRSIAPASIIEKTTTTPTKKKIDRKRSLPKMQNTTKTTMGTVDEKRAKKMEMNDGIATKEALMPKLSPSLFTKFGSNNDNKQPSKIAATLTKTQAMGKGLTNETSYSPPPTLSACNSKSISPDGPSQGPLECNKCKKCNDLHLLIFCETCKFNYHIGCLDPPLERMPTKNKFSRFECSDCAEENEPGPDEMEPKAKDKQLPNDWKLSAMRTRRRTLL